MRSIVLGVVLLTVAWSAASAQAPQETVVQPGSRVGPLTLGAPMPEAMTAGEALFGRTATRSRDCTTSRDLQAGSQRCTLQFWNAVTLGEMSGLVFLGPPGQERLIAILTGRRGHRTAEGIGAGSLLSDAIRFYGTPERDVPGLLRGPIIPVGSGQTVALLGAEATFYSAAWWPGRGLGVFHRQSIGEISTLVVLRP